MIRPPGVRHLHADAEGLRLGFGIQQRKGGDPVSDCLEPRALGAVTWIFASERIRVA